MSRAATGLLAITVLVLLQASALGLRLPRSDAVVPVPLVADRAPRGPERALPAPAPLSGGSAVRVLTLDIRDPRHPVVVNLAKPVWHPVYEMDLIETGEFALGVGGYGELRVLDLRVPEAPRWMERDYSLAVVDHYAYVATGSRGLRLVDLTAPTGRWQVAHIPMVRSARSVWIHGDYAYVGLDGPIPAVTGYD